MNQTENIGLNKIDPIADGEQYFNVDTHLNNNWDIIDQEISNRPTRDELNGTSQQTLDVKSDLNNVSTILGGNYVATGLAFSTSGLTANFTAGIAVVNGARYSIAAGSINLNANQGQYLYVDTDGTIKSTTTQATADAKCPLWYFSTNTTAAIVSTDRRTINVITVDPSQAPSGSVGKMGQFLSWIANRIKAITGKSNWYDTPSTTLEAANTHMNDNVKHVTQTDKDNWNGKLDASTYNNQVNQDVRTTATPTFAGMHITGDLTVDGGGFMKPRSSKTLTAQVNAGAASTILSLTGAGRLGVLRISLGVNGTGNVTVTIDGVAVINNVALIGATDQYIDGYGNTLAQSGNSSVALEANLQFKSSISISITTAGASATAKVSYDIE
jgi:hypothetical protein